VRVSEGNYKTQIGKKSVPAEFHPVSKLPLRADGDDRYVDMVLLAPDGSTDPGKGAHVIRVAHTARVNSGRLYERYLNKGFIFLRDAPAPKRASAGTAKE
jgi:hypothetical protein